MKQIRIFSIIFALTFLIVTGCGGGGGGGSSNNTGSNSGGTAAISLAWDANSSPGIAGYKLHYGTTSGNYPTVIDVGNTTTYTVANLQSGLTYYFVVTDYDTSGDESHYSNEISGNAR